MSRLANLVKTYGLDLRRGGFTPLSAVATQSYSKGRVLWSVVAKNIQRSQITAMAAALSFRTIFGLIPVMVVSLVVLHRFVPETKVKETVTNFLDYTGLTKIVVQEPPPPAPTTASVPGLNIFGFGGGTGFAPGLSPIVGTASPRIDGAEVGAVGTGAPSAAHSMTLSATTPQASPMHASATQAAAQSQRLEDWITQLLSRVDGINFGAIGLVSLLMLLYAALSMVVEIEKAFNQIAEAPSGKTWIKRLTHYWTLLTLGPMLLVLGFAVAQGLQPLLRSKLEWVLPMSSTVLLDVLGSVIAIPISAIALMILYTSVPNKRIDFRAALWGGLGAAILWELSKWGLVGYIKYTSSYARLYGVIALLPLFLLWVYVTWIIVLVGFQVTATLQTFRVISREGFQKSVLIALGLMTDPRGNGSHAPGFAHGFAQRVRVLDHSLPLRAMVTIAHRFQGGLTTDVALLSNELATDEALVQGVMDRLCNAGLLNKVSLEGSDGVLKTAHQPTYALAKPASVIMASEVFAAGEDMLEGARDTSRISAELRQARLERFRARTVADLVADVTGQGTPSVPPTLPAAPMHLA